MRILFISATRIGDAVLSTGLLDHLIRRYPTARFTIACGPVACGVFARVPQCERILVMHKQRWDLHWLGLWRQVVVAIWDLVVDLRGSAVSWFLAARQRRIMRGGRRPGHKLAQLAAVLTLPGIPLPRVWTAPADDARAAALIPDQLGPVIGLGPTANWRGKIWPPERFAALIRSLTATAGLLAGATPVVFAGPGPEEAALSRPVLDALPQAIDLTGQLSLPEAAACLRRCSLFVGNDSGLMHLSAAAGTPTLGLFGPSRAEEYAPSGPRAAFVRAPGPSGIGDLANLSVERVVVEATRLLNAVRGTV